MIKKDCYLLVGIDDDGNPHIFYDNKWDGPLCQSVSEDIVDYAIAEKLAKDHLLHRYKRVIIAKMQSFLENRTIELFEEDNERRI